MGSRGRARASTDVAALSAARRREILQDRGRRLADRIGAETATPGVRVLVCQVGENLYGLDMAEVAKVRPFARWGAAAGGHPAVLGLIAHDGEVRPALDLGLLLGGHGATDLPGGWLVILAPPHRTALRLQHLPVTADIELLPQDEGRRARILSGEHQDKLLVTISAHELLDQTKSFLHGAAAP